MRNGILGAALAAVVGLSLFVAYTQLQGDTPVPPAPTPAPAAPAAAPRPAEPSIQDQWQAGHDEAYLDALSYCSGGPSRARDKAGESTSFLAGYMKGWSDTLKDIECHPQQ